MLRRIVCGVLVVAFAAAVGCSSGPENKVVSPPKDAKPPTVKPVKPGEPGGGGGGPTVE
jgi:hypothetical protein